jgi:hypothetical protein
MQNYNFFGKITKMNKNHKNIPVFFSISFRELSNTNLVKNVAAYSQKVHSNSKASLANA